LKDKIKAIDKNGQQRGNRAMVRVLLLGILMWKINIDECHWKVMFLSKTNFRHFGHTRLEK
jgi:hypothetical protein